MAAAGSPIIGFMHVCMMNEYMRIVSEQLMLMRSSGLFDRVKEIRVGVTGSAKNKDSLEQFFAPFEKISIVAHSEDHAVYEFLTLKELKKTADLKDFYGFYIHTKGVSWPGHEGGKYWRDYMNHYNLTQWRDALDRLRLGYDTCGVKMVNGRFPLHYSGNFFWFNSEYIRRLKPISSLNQKDRFNAEMWPCSGQPICATLCQDFVDYNTKGIFKP